MNRRWYDILIAIGVATLIATCFILAIALGADRCL